MHHAGRNGRYLQPEPLALLDPGMSPAGYAYAQNNPISNSDPTGLFKRSFSDIDCPNWKKAVDLAKKWAGCTPSGTNTTCTCQKAISGLSGGCDICPFLEEGAGPEALLKNWGVFGTRAHTNACDPNAYRYLTDHTEANSIAFAKRFCTDPIIGSNVEDLAELMIHEATHFCSTASGCKPVLDPGANDVGRACKKAGGK